MRLVKLDGEPPIYYAQCTQRDVYTSKVWNPSSLGPLYHYGDGDQYPTVEPDTEDTTP